jgi:hypothetical protein
MYDLHLLTRCRRAGKKRDAEDPQGSSHDDMQETKKRKKYTRRAESVKTAVDSAAGGTAKDKKAPKGLLDMPAGKCPIQRTSLCTMCQFICVEIRNHIYGYAVESEFEGSWSDPAPLISPAREYPVQKQWPLDPRKPSARRFFGLTQVCKKLRTEYRPIWLLNSSVRLMQQDIRLYIHTFYCGASKWENLPKLLQISAKDPFNGESVVDLSLLLRIHGHSSNTKIEFVPHILTEDDGPWIETPCMDCEAEAEMLGLNDGSLPECDHEAQNFEDFVGFTLETQFPYLDALNDFLENDNPRWLSDIRSRKVARVKLDLDGYTVPDVLIHLNPNAKVVRKTRIMTNLQDYVDKYCKDRGLFSRDYELRFQLVASANMQL